MAIRVLIAEDQRVVRQCFARVLEQSPEFEVVGTAIDGEEAVLMAERHRPDVVLMDMEMPNLDGIGATRLIHERVPGAKVLFLSLHDSPSQIRKAMDADIAGFLTKDVELKELVRIVRAVAESQPVESPYLADRKLIEAQRKIRGDLTLRQVQVLRLMAAGDSNQEIAERLFTSEQTVKKEVVRLLEVLGVKNRTQAAIVGMELGFLGAEAPSKKGGRSARRVSQGRSPEAR